MADRPIIFSAPMIAALLAGRKTQTRRILRRQPEPCDHEHWPDEPVARWTVDVDGAHCGVCGNGTRLANTRSGVAGLPVPARVGDRLYVRENHALVPSSAYRMSEGVEQTINPGDRDLAAIYAAGWDRSKPRWRPSIHMPRWASRLTLLVTDVRVERLQDISEVDAIDEGALMVDLPTQGAPTERGRPPLGQPPSQRFRHLWNSINGADAWDANPWIAAVSFTVHARNIDQLARIVEAAE